MNPIFCFRGVVCLLRTGRNEVTRVRGGELTRVRGGEHLSDNEFVRSCVRVLSSLWLCVQSELLPFSKG